MTNPAFLVDGHLEKKFVQKICPGKVVRIIGCNGKSVQMSAIAKKVASHCRLLKGKCYPIIIIIDRESRSTSCEEIREELLMEMQSHNVKDNVIIGVADRMIENWILADYKTVEENCKTIKKLSGCQDGSHGKKVISECMTGKYHETTVGVMLLDKCRASIMRTSKSFESFFDQLTEIKCHWLER